MYPPTHFVQNEDKHANGNDFGHKSNKNLDDHTVLHLIDERIWVAKTRIYVP